MFISIKRLLESGKKAGEEQTVVEALRQMGRLLLDGIGNHAVCGREADMKALRLALQELSRRIDEPPTAMGVLSIASDATEALETYCARTTGYFQEANDHMQSMVAMLAGTVAELSGRTDASVARLQAIEKKLERAKGLDDIRVLRANLEECLLALREAAAHQRSTANATMERLQQEIGAVQKRPSQGPKSWRTHFADLDSVAEAADAPFLSKPTSYVAVFRLQRAEHIGNRFGEHAKHQMLAMIGAQLKTVVGPEDRLLRWKSASFVLFVNSTDSLHEIRVRLSDSVATMGQRYIEVGKKSALLSVGVDWVVFPQEQCPTLEAVFAEVDAFLANSKPGASLSVETQS